MTRVTVPALHAPALGRPAPLSLRAPPESGGSAPCYKVPSSPGRSHSSWHGVTPAGGRRECGFLCASFQSGCLLVWWSWESSSSSSWWGSAGASAALIAAVATSAARVAQTPAAALRPVSNVTHGETRIDQKKRHLPIRQRCALSALSATFPSTPEWIIPDCPLLGAPDFLRWPFLFAFSHTGASPCFWSTLTPLHLEFSLTLLRKGRAGSGWWGCGVRILPSPWASKLEKTFSGHASHKQRTLLFTATYSKYSPWVPSSHRWVLFTPMTKRFTKELVLIWGFPSQAHIGIKFGTPAINILKERDTICIFSILRNTAVSVRCQAICCTFELKEQGHVSAHCWLCLSRRG